MGRKEVAFRKQQILRMTVPQLAKLVIDKFDSGTNDQSFEEDMRGGLYEALRERPELAAGIAPSLVQDDERLMRIFLELLCDIWMHDEALMIKLLKKAKQIRNKRIQSLIDDMIWSYKEGAGLDALPEFILFMRELKL